MKFVDDVMFDMLQLVVKVGSVTFCKRDAKSGYPRLSLENLIDKLKHVAHVVDDLMFDMLQLVVKVGSVTFCERDAKSGYPRLSLENLIDKLKHVAHVSHP